jgi:hypothetical protein
MKIDNKPFYGLYIEDKFMVFFSIVMFSSSKEYTIDTECIKIHLSLN